MDLNLLTAISPIDGRYRSKTEPLAAYFSEYALIRYRVRVEIEYFVTLCELPLPQLQDIDHACFEPLRDIYRQFTRTERMLRSTLSNKGLIRMLAFQRSLVYFSTSVKTDRAVLNKVRQGALVKLYTEDDELLDDPDDDD